MAAGGTQPYRYGNPSLCLALLLWISPPTVCGRTEKVLLVSFDGFRWDYLDFIPGLKNFPAVAANGSSAEYMNNTFTTLTFSTHFSMATGLYQESHGVVSNYMWDPEFREDFWPGCQPCLDQKWWGGEPIWITATKQGKKVGCLFWPGTEVVYDGVYPAFVEKYTTEMLFEDRVDTVLNWFVNEDIDLGTLYFHQPDEAGHKHGPRSLEVRRQVQYVDRVLGYLMSQIRHLGLDSTLNTVIVSDHGLANMSNERVIEVPQYVDWALVDKFVEVGAICHVFAKPGHIEEVYEALEGAHEHMSVYRREDVPAHWHYSNNRRIGDILLVIDEHWACTEVSPSDSLHIHHPNPVYFQNKSAEWNHDLGNHGYDNRLLSMKPIFMATGPDIKQGHVVRPFMSLDIYPLTAALLGVRPAPNNGTLAIVGDILREPWEPHSSAIRSPSPASGTPLSMATLSLCVLLPWLRTLTERG